MILRGSGPVLLRNPIFLCVFFPGGVWTCLWFPCHTHYLYENTDTISFFGYINDGTAAATAADDMMMILTKSPIMLATERIVIQILTINP